MVNHFSTNLLEVQVQIQCVPKSLQDPVKELVVGKLDYIVDLPRLTVELDAVTDGQGEERQEEDQASSSQPQRKN